MDSLRNAPIFDPLLRLILRVYWKTRALWNVLIAYLLACAQPYELDTQSPILVRLGFQDSKIPQFIRDIDSPWVNQNIAVLGSIDAADALCNAKSPLRSQLPAIPDDLFKDLVVDNNQARIKNRLGWQNARDRLQEILNCAEALRRCENFRVDLYRYSGGFDPFWEPHEPPAAVPHLFADVLSRMESLQRLEWMRPSDDISVTTILDSVFREHEVYLPTVTEMHLGPNMHFLVPLAPNLEVLTTLAGYTWTNLRTTYRAAESHPDPHIALIDAAQNTKHLRHFRMHSKWDRDLALRVAKAMPDLRMLTLDGRIGSVHYGGSFSEGSSRLKDILSAFEGLEDLYQLRLPSTGDLGLAYYDEPECGNIYFGVSGTKFGREQLRTGMVQIEKAGDLVARSLPQLTHLCIGSTCADCENRTECGGIIWPWTGQGLREYLLEAWPRYKQGDSPGSQHEHDEDEDPDGPVLETWEQDGIMLDENWGVEQGDDFDNGVP